MYNVGVMNRDAHTSSPRRWPCEGNLGPPGSGVGVSTVAGQVALARAQTISVLEVVGARFSCLVGRAGGCCYGDGWDLAALPKHGGGVLGRAPTPA